MAYDKRLTKTERQTIVKARRGVKQTGFRESEKHLSALRHQHVAGVRKVEDARILVEIE